MQFWNECINQNDEQNRKLPTWIFFEIVIFYILFFFVFVLGFCVKVLEFLGSVPCVLWGFSTEIGGSGMGYVETLPLSSNFTL